MVEVVNALPPSHLISMPSSQVYRVRDHSVERMRLIMGKVDWGRKRTPLDLENDRIPQYLQQRVDQTVLAWVTKRVGVQRM